MKVEQLETRDTPAAFDPTAYAAGFEPVTGYRGAVVVTHGDVNGDGSVDTIYAVADGGAPRVVARSGGTPGAGLVPSSTPGVLKVAGEGDELFSGFVFEKTFLGGVDVAVIRRPGQSDLLAFVPGVGGGDRVHVMALDGSGIDYSFSALNDPNFRGGLTAQSATVRREFPVQPHQFGIHLLITPRVGSGGGPRAVAFDASGVKVADLIAGDPADRRGITVIGAGVDLPGQPQRHGLYTEDADGIVSAFDWSGNQYAITDDSF